jgi:hypothetical protein
MVEQRKGFTSIITDKLITPLMEFEKRMAPATNEAFKALESTSLDLRLAAEKESEELNRKASEEARAKVHFENELHRIVTDFKNVARREIVKQYEASLNSGLAPELDVIMSEITKLGKSPLNKFQSAYISRERLTEIWDNTLKPDWQSIAEDLTEFAEKTFANFKHDLQNKTAAINAAKDDAKLLELTEIEKTEATAAINTIIATAEVVTVEAPKIKRQLTVTVIESETWAKQIIAAFVINLPHLGKYLRVKSWSRLSIGQMAEALGKHATESGELITGLKYKEVCK